MNISILFEKKFSIQFDLQQSRSLSLFLSLFLPPLISLYLFFLLLSPFLSSPLFHSFETCLNEPGTNLQPASPTILLALPHRTCRCLMATSRFFSFVCGFFVCLFFWVRVTLWSPGWCRTFYIYQAVLELK